MTREIGDLLINQVVESDYDIERKIRLIERIEKLCLKAATYLVEVAADKEAEIEKATELLEQGMTVREVADTSGISYRRVSEASKRLRDRFEENKKAAEERLVQEPIAEHIQEDGPTEVIQQETPLPTRSVKVENNDNVIDNDNDNIIDNNSDNDIDNEIKDIEESEAKPRDENGNIITGDTPENEELALVLMQKAKRILGNDTPEYESMRELYNKGEPYERLVRYWDYMSKNAGWLPID